MIANDEAMLRIKLAIFELREGATKIIESDVFDPDEPAVACARSVLAMLDEFEKAGKDE